MSQELLDASSDIDAQADAGRSPAGPTPAGPFVLPTSFAQRRLWFLHRLDPNSSVYNIPFSVRLSGPLDTPLLSRCFEEVVGRHEALRTTFAIEDGQPVQIVHDFAPVGLVQHVDLSRLNESERAGEALRLATLNATRPFDLESGPLMRVSLLRLSAIDHVLSVVLHHVVADGWSVTRLLRELESLYTAYQAGLANPLPALPLQYGDYAAWQHEVVAHDTIASQLNYWQQQLRGPLPVLDLPADWPRPARQTVCSARETWTVPAAVTLALRRLSQAAQATPFMTMLAVFNILLYRLTGENDVIVGTPVAGRTLPEIEALIGCFLNTLALRTKLRETATFSEMLAVVRQVTLDAYDHQDIPFEHLLAALQPERDLSRTPVFQVMLNWLDEGSNVLQLPGIVAEFLPLPEIGSKFDMTLYVRDRGNELGLTLVYNADLFSQARVREMLRQYDHLLAQIVADPEARLNAYSLVPNETVSRLPRGTRPLEVELQPQSFLTHFERRVQEQASATAVVDRWGTWTYRDLHQHSGQLAAYLTLQGVERGDVVAIYADRGGALIWALLGVHMAGAAFLILDPAYPATRLVAYLESVPIAAWIQLATAEPPPAAVEAAVRALPLKCRLSLPATAAETPLGKLASEPMPARCADGARQDELAYVIFTSGTSGRPKPVFNTMRPLTHFLAWYARSFAVAASDRFSMLSGLAHDPLLRDIFAPLWLGATLCIPPRPDRAAPRELAHWLMRENLSVVHLTPAMGEYLLSGFSDADRWHTLRYAFFGGDRLTWRHVADLQGRSPRVHVVNFYGATETPQAMGCYLVPAATALTGENESGASVPARRSLPLGKGIDGVQLLVLNAEQQLAGVGELGEICVRTPFLARGYLNDELLTAARFIANPLTGEENDRLYLTGDLGRYLPDGNVSFAGRVDRQLKIRGFRVEPAEVEYVLSQHPSVQTAVVSLHVTGSEDRQLVAYVQPAPGTMIETERLREWLAQQLPAYALPSTFVPVNQVPLTVNGKVDFGALPPVAMTSANDYTPPESGVERKLAAVWEEVLERQPVGVNEDFFALGGHSMLAIRLFARMDREFDRRLPLATLFAFPTVRQLARLLAEENDQETVSSLVPIKPEGGRPPLFFVHGGAGHVFHYQKLAESLALDQPFYGLQPLGWDAPRVEPPQVESLAASYVAAVRSQQQDGPYYLGGFCFGGTIAMEMARQLEDAGQAVALLTLLEPGPPHLRSNGGPAPAVALPLAASPIEQPRRSLWRRLARFGKSMAVRFAKVVVRNNFQRLQNQARRAAVQFYLRSDRPIPRFLRDYYILNFVTSKSWQEHWPRPIRAPMILILHASRSPRDPRWHWLALTSSEVETHVVADSHFAVLEKPHVGRVGRLLSQAMAGIQADASGGS